MFFKIDVLKIIANFTGKHLNACNFAKMRLRHRRFPVKLAKFSSTPFFTEHHLPLLVQHKSLLTSTISLLQSFVLRISDIDPKIT